jgi:hypothetical protein
VLDHQQDVEAAWETCITVGEVHGEDRVGLAAPATYAYGAKGAGESA